MFIPDGQVSLNAKIERRGFCEGEDIRINAKFENTCSRIVVPKAAIIAKHTYQASGRTKVFRQKLSSVRGNHIISGMCDAWQGKSIRVPKIKPSMLGCNMIRVEYALMVSRPRPQDTHLLENVTHFRLWEENHLVELVAEDQKIRQELMLTAC